MHLFEITGREFDSLYISIIIRKLRTAEAAKISGEKSILKSL